MNKQELRTLIRQRKKLYTADRLLDMSLSATSTLKSLICYQKARTILLYNALPDEVQTLSLLDDEEANNKKKNFILPAVIGNKLELRRYQGVKDLKEGAFHIMEPQGQAFTNYLSIDLAVIPAMAYDRNGHRLGRGKGYYDRLIPHLQCPIVGLCFDFQLMENVPTETHDCPVDCIITEQRIYETNSFEKVK